MLRLNKSVMGQFVLSIQPEVADYLTQNNSHTTDMTQNYSQVIKVIFNCGWLLTHCLFSISFRNHVHFNNCRICPLLDFMAILWEHCDLVKTLWRSCDQFSCDYSEYCVRKIRYTHSCYNYIYRRVVGEMLSLSFCASIQIMSLRLLELFWFRLVLLRSTLLSFRF